MGLFDWNKGAGTPPCPAGSICSGQAKTNVGKKPGNTSGTGIYHATSTKIIQGTGTEISGSETVVYVIKNNTWQPAAITKDGGKTYQFSDPNYPLMDAVAGADLVNDLKSNKRSDIQKNIDAGVQKKLNESGFSLDDQSKVIDSKKNTETVQEPEKPPAPEEKKTGLLDGDSFSGEIGSTGRNRNEFPNLVFPTGLGSTEQDVVIFDMLEYIPQNFDGKFSVQSTNRKSSERGIGRVTLPIPAGISDANSVSWSGQNMNAIDVVLGNIALVGTTDGLGAAANTAVEIGKEIQQNSGEVGTAIGAGFAGLAAGVGGQLLTRTTGAIFNPNMELLFSGPSLRPFAFSFLLAPRNDGEAQSIRSIIRFFKQGSAPQKSPSTLFLKSPHTFRVGYKHRGSEQSHPYLNKFKECALQSVSVQYTPNGNYATVGENGAMASYQMSLQFQELEPVFNEDYGSGSGSSGPDTEIGF